MIKSHDAIAISVLSASNIVLFFLFYKLTLSIFMIITVQ